MAIKLECGSYLDALRAVQSGSCAAVLPNIARVNLKEGTYLKIPLRELPGAQRKICLIWNPRVAEVRESVAKAVNVLSLVLVF